MDNYFRNVKFDLTLIFSRDRSGNPFLFFNIKPPRLRSG